MPPIQLPIQAGAIEQASGYFGYMAAIAYRTRQLNIWWKSTDFLGRGRAAQGSLGSLGPWTVTGAIVFLSYDEH